MTFILSEALGRRGLRGYLWLCLVGLLLFLPTGWVSAWTWERDLRWFYLFLISFFLSVLLVPSSIYLAVRFMVFDMPDPRKVHKVATPRLGGLAVYGGVVLALLRNFQWSPQLIGLLCGGTVIYLTGVVEDVKGLSAHARLIGQLAACAIAIGSGISVTFLPHEVPWAETLEVAITVLWLVGMTNAFNFLDGVDGLAAGMGLLSALLFIAVGWPERQGQLVYAAAALGGACLGFIPYNWHPAKVFLGDSGATFIGFMLAGMALLGAWSFQKPIFALSSPLLILAIPIFDMIYTTISRIRNGSVQTFTQWLEHTAKDHFHHRLMRLGMSGPEAVGFILMVNLALGLAAVVTHFATSVVVPILLIVQSCIIFMIIVVLMLLGRDVKP